MEEERKKQEKLKEKKVEAAVTQAVEDPDKQPILKAHKNADHDTFFFCNANCCQKYRTEIAPGEDDGSRGCCVQDCSYWLCDSGNCKKQMKNHIKNCLFKKTFKENFPYKK